MDKSTVWDSVENLQKDFLRRAKKGSEKLMAKYRTTILIGIVVYLILTVIFAPVVGEVGNQVISRLDQVLLGAIIISLILTTVTLLLAILVIWRK